MDIFEISIDITEELIKEIAENKKENGTIECDIRKNIGKNKTT